MEEIAGRIDLEQLKKISAVCITSGPEDPSGIADRLPGSGVGVSAATAGQGRGEGRGDEGGSLAAGGGLSLALTPTPSELGMRAKPSVSHLRHLLMDQSFVYR